jgi:hypothetical protein
LVAVSTPNEPTTGPRRRTVLVALLAGVLAVALVTAWVLVTRSTGDDPRSPAGLPASSAAVVDLTTLSVERAAFCDRLGSTAVRKALEAPVTGSDQYRSGERVLLAPGVSDVSHEFGCTYKAATGAQARVWVFAEPVTRHEAARIRREVRGERGCRPVDARPAFGRSAAGTVCPAATRSGQRVTLRGLFGDAWLSCEVTTAGSEARAEVVRRGSRWCVQVATALGGDS